MFAERLTGVWLLGSGAYGGFGAESDLDVQAIVDGPPTGAEIDRLVALIAHPHLACPAAGLEFVLYERRVLEHPSPPLEWSLNLNGGPKRARSVSTDPARHPWHWFVLDLAAGRELAVTLHGTDLADVVGPISDEDQLAAITESVRWHDENEPASTNQTYAAARGLMYLETGTHPSKPAARAWLASTGRTPQDAIEELRAALRTRGA